MPVFWVGCNTQSVSRSAVPEGVVSRYSTSRAGDVMRIGWESKAGTFYSVSYREKTDQGVRRKFVSKRVLGTGDWITIEDHLDAGISRVYRIEELDL